MSAPSEAQVAQLMSLSPKVPVAAIDLFQINDRTKYGPEDPENGTPDAEISGEETYAIYATIAGPFISGLGGRIVFSTPVDQIMQGPAEPQWDLVAIMFFSARNAFLEML